MKIFVIGAGAVGGSLALALHKGRQNVIGISDINEERVLSVARRVKAAAFASSLPGEIQNAHVVIVAVPDPLISSIADQARRAGVARADQVWLHLSGAFGADELSPLAAVDQEAMTPGLGTFHPALVFAPNMVTNIPRDTVFAVDGNCDRVFAVTEELAHSIAGKIVRVKGEKRADYHAALVLASNCVAALLAEARGLLVENGQSEQEAEDITVSLAQSAILRAVSDGIDRSLSGPIQRGNSQTVARHLATLRDKSDCQEIYKVLGRATLRLASKSGNLTQAQVAELAVLLK